MLIQHESQEVCDDDVVLGLVWHTLAYCSPGKYCQTDSQGVPHCITQLEPCFPWCSKEVANGTSSNETTTAEIDAGSDTDTETSEKSESESD